MKIPFVKKLNHFAQEEFSIVGNVEISFEELAEPLTFDFNIENEYPLKSYDSESITFSNIDLLRFNHVMRNGNVCIHTSHSINIEQKVRIDFNALKNWIIKYYIRGEQDVKYEHIVVDESTIDGSKYSFIFTDTDKSFKKNEFGIIKLSALNYGQHREDKILNFYVKSFQKFQTIDVKLCQWSDFYRAARLDLEGVYYFSEAVPAIHGRFAVSNWNELNLSSDFVEFLYGVEQKLLKKKKGEVIPVFIGYNINSSEIHWQVALLKVGEFPLKGIAEKAGNFKTGKWKTTIISSEINWGISRNSSYKYFFGRGAFSDVLTKKKILIIGIGAVGSMVAQTLTRCGCTRIDFIDYDIKEPENVCRSEYRFFTGITNKSTELEEILFEISPFINSIRLNNKYFEKLIKSYYTDPVYQNKFKEDLENYDLIFDCSTDNDLMHVLNSLQLNIELVNISITNHAKELVFAFYPNIYQFVNNQFTNVLNNDITDLHEPTGCWNPTFKASYNDIAVLVQLALKHFNKIEKNDKAKNNFVIQEIDSNLKIIEF